MEKAKVNEAKTTLISLRTFFFQYNPVWIKKKSVKEKDSTGNRLLNLTYFSSTLQLDSPPNMSSFHEIPLEIVFYLTWDFFRKKMSLKFLTVIFKGTYEENFFFLIQKNRRSFGNQKFNQRRVFFDSEFNLIQK